LLMRISLSQLKGQEVITYAEQIAKTREKKDHELAHRKKSPLQKVDRKHFHGLNYYPIDEAWKKSADFSRNISHDTLDIMTSSGRIKQFERYGRFIIEHEATKDTLFGYKRIWPEGYVYEGDPYLFIPFTDFTTGSECYGGGRYMDIPIPADDATTVEIDFNTCYNPYCAYGGGFSCPIPPKENDLHWKVEAGEQNYGNH